MWDSHLSLGKKKDISSFFDYGENIKYGNFSDKSEEKRKNIMVVLCQHSWRHEIFEHLGQNYWDLVCCIYLQSEIEQDVSANTVKHEALQTYEWNMWADLWSIAMHKIKIKRSDNVEGILHEIEFQVKFLECLVNI